MNIKGDISEADLQRVACVLDKQDEDEPILLDWNAFEPSSHLKEPELKDIAARLLPDLAYDAIKGHLREAVTKKRKDILASAKERE